MRILYGGATQRGVICLPVIAQFAASHTLEVATFPEQPWEPRFVEDMRTGAEEAGARFHVLPRLTLKALEPLGPLPDLIILVNWRTLVPPTVHSRAGLGAYAFHDSLLPTYRGFSPTLWAVRNGERETGASLFRLGEEVDSGELIDQERVAIDKEDTIATVFESVTAAYVAILRRSLPRLLEGAARGAPQDHSRATWTCRWLPEDARIDWKEPTARIFDLIRATTRPYPGAFTTLGGKKLTIWSAARPRRSRRFVGAVPGRIVEIGEDGVAVLTGDGELVVREVQIEGSDPCQAVSLLNSMSMTLGG